MTEDNLDRLDNYFGAEERAWQSEKELALRTKAAEGDADAQYQFAQLYESGGITVKPDAVIRQLQQGDTVTLTGETNGNWTQIQHNGETGWVSTEFLK